MRFSRHLMAALTVFLLMAGNVGLAQIETENEEKLIERAGEYALKLVQLRSNLPRKWAALQERSERHLTQIKKQKVGVVNKSEFTASHRDRKITIHRVRGTSRVDDALSTKPPIDWKSEPFGNSGYWIFQQPGLTLFKERESKWQDVPTIAKNQYPTADPLGWTLGSFSIAADGGYDERFLERFFIETRVCVSSKVVPEGLSTYWGFPKKREKTVGTKVLFDKVTHLPVSVEWDYYHQGWEAETYASFPYTTTTKATIHWDEFKNRDAKILLPTKIESVQTAIGDMPHHVELTNRIRWLLNDEVPDSLFDDPSKGEVVLPAFPDNTEE